MKSTRLPDFQMILGTQCRQLRRRIRARRAAVPQHVAGRGGVRRGAAANGMQRVIQLGLGLWQQTILRLHLQWRGVRCVQTRGYDFQRQRAQGLDHVPSPSRDARCHHSSSKFSDRNAWCTYDLASAWQWRIEALERGKVQGLDLFLSEFTLCCFKWWLYKMLRNLIVVPVFFSEKCPLCIFFKVTGFTR